MASDGSSTSPFILVAEVLMVVGAATAILSYGIMKVLALVDPRRKELRQQRLETRALRKEQAMTHLRGLSVWAQATAIKVELGVRRYVRYSRYQPRHAASWTRPSVG